MLRMRLLPPKLHGPCCTGWLRALLAEAAQRRHVLAFKAPAQGSCLMCEIRKCAAVSVHVGKQWGAAAGHGGCCICSLLELRCGRHATQAHCFISEITVDGL